jgi:tetratricopeptide (TPR) repeat protein
MKRACRVACCLLALLAVLTLIPSRASAEAAYPSYTYNGNGQPVPTAVPYEATIVLNTDSLGIGPLDGPTDLYVTDEGEIFVLDAGNDRVVVLRKDFQADRVIIPTDDEGEPLDFKSPSGISVCADGTILLCDRKGKAVYILDEEGKQLRKVEKPDSSILPKNFQFQPVKAEMDSGGILYVVSSGSYSGALQFDVDGSFMGFYGSEEVDLTLKVLLDHFWKNILSDEAAEDISRTVPVEFISFCIDKKDFIFTIRKGNEVNSGQVRKLNAKGDNVLDDTKVFGDRTDSALLADLVVDDEGFITIIDSGTGRVMQYDPDGELLYAFAGKGSQAGTFSTPAAVESIGDSLLVLDKDRGLITLFTPTEFAKNVRLGTLLYRDGRYKEAMEPWQAVLTRDNNYALANIGMGKIYEGLGDYPAAMDYYEKGDVKNFYSDAFEKNRADLLRENFALVMLAVLIVIAVPMVLLNRKPVAKERYTGGRLKRKYPFYCLLHPLTGYDDLKSERSGSFWLATLIVAALFLVSVLAHQLTGFAFNTNRTDELNLWVILCSTVGVFIAFVTCNWAVTTIMDGEGSFGEIWVFSAYALLPLVLFNGALIVLSNVLTLDEATFYYAIQWIGYGWTAICMFIAIREVHQYTLVKTLVTLAITFAGLVIVVVIVAIVYSVFGQLIGFISTIWSEITLHL